MTAEQLDKSSNRIAAMFNAIAPYYDSLNHFLSAGFDRRWRQHLVHNIAKQHPAQILDVATGTGDLALLMQQKTQALVTAVDIAGEMLAIAKRKQEAKYNKQKAIVFLQAQAEKLPFPNHSFDAVTVAFGIRNFENPAQALEEMLRVLKPAGTLAILELTTPVHFPVKQLYHFYSFHVIPFLGGLYSKRRQAYHYLPHSVNTFPQRDKFLALLKHTHLTTEENYKPLTAGICCLYTAIKK